VLQVAVRGADRVIEPGGHEDADRGHAPGMDVEKAEDLRLGIPEGVQGGAGAEVHVLPQVDDHLHADRPLAPMPALGKAEALVELSCHGPHGAIAHHGEGSPDVHAGHVARLGHPALVRPLVHQADADNPAVLDEGRGHGGARPDLDHTGAHDLRADPLGELADGEDQAAVLLQEGRNVGEGEGVLLDGEDGAEEPDHLLAPTGSRR
jgi:hypothetical protein